MNTIAVLGSGIVGQVLANGFLAHGYQVMRGTREPARLGGWKTGAGAKAEVKAILDRFGWETEDLGAVEAARAIEPLCMLWCILGLTRNSWTPALKLLKA